MIDQCDYEYVDASATSYGIAGCFIYNKTDHSKQIFLPSLSFDDTQVWYWSSEICGTQDDLSNCATAFLGSFDGNSFTMGFYAVGLGSDAFLYRPVIEASGSFNCNDHDYVDLGITINGKKLYFSTMDLGASEVGQSGIPSRWGATDYYGEEWVAPGFHKPDWNPGKRLDAEHDIATIEWGTAWHMPSPEEWDMLVEQCDYERKEASDCIYGVSGYFFYKRSDHSTFIFLPVANWCDELQYWTSEIGMPYAGETTAIVFGSNENSIGCISTGGLSSGGMSVRPVFVK